MSDNHPPGISPWATGEPLKCPRCKRVAEFVPNQEHDGSANPFWWCSGCHLKFDGSGYFEFEEKCSHRHCQQPGTEFYTCDVSEKPCDEYSDLHCEGREYDE